MRKLCSNVRLLPGSRPGAILKHGHEGWIVKTAGEHAVVRRFTRCIEVRTLIAGLLSISSCVLPVSAGTHTIDVAQLIETDARAFEQFQQGLMAIVAPHLAMDDSGLIGRNKQWGALYSPRFQMGAGFALRIALAAERPAETVRAFRALEAGTDVIQPDGYVPSRLPEHIVGTLSNANIASGAAFFLGDACLGYLSLEASRFADENIPNHRLSKVRTQLASALSWLLNQQNALMEVDELAPNRLLFNARSFQACGQLAANKETQSAAYVATKRFVDSALELYADEGHFIESGGHDTSYQGVAIRVAEDILLAGYDDQQSQLGDKLASAAIWLSKRVDTSGRIDSSGNTRTCWSDEHFLGKKKLVSVSEVFLGLAYSAIRTGNESVLASAASIEEWALTNRNSNPCFP